MGVNFTYVSHRRTDPSLSFNYIATPAPSSSSSVPQFKTYSPTSDRRASLVVQAPASAWPRLLRAKRPSRSSATVQARHPSPATSLSPHPPRRMTNKQELTNSVQGQQQIGSVIASLAFLCSFRGQQPAEVVVRRSQLPQIKDECEHYGAATFQGEI